MPDWASGGGGLVSTASDYIRFAMMLANDGALGDVRILEPETLALMASEGEIWRSGGYVFLQLEYATRLMRRLPTAQQHERPTAVATSGGI